MRRGRKGSFQIHWFSRRKHDGEQSFAGLFLVVHMPQAANQRGRFMTQFYCILAAGNDFQFWILIFLLVWQLITYDRSVSEGGHDRDNSFSKKFWKTTIMSCWHNKFPFYNVTISSRESRQADRKTKLEEHKGRQTWQDTSTKLFCLPLSFQRSYPKVIK